MATNTLSRPARPASVSAEARHRANGDQAVEAAQAIVAAALAAAPNTGRLDFARRFALRAVAAWWRTIAGKDEARFPLRPLFDDTAFSQGLSPSLGALADSMGALAGALNEDSAAYRIGLAYTSLLPPDYRSRHGIYYTPPALTDRLLDQVTRAGVDWATCRVLDPACGGGAFLAPVARRIVEALPDCEPGILVRNIGARLLGYEIDPFAAWLAQVTLDAALFPLARASGQRPPILVSVRDSLRDHDARASFDLVIGNPPYGRVTLNAQDRAAYQRSLYGHANLYGLFTDLALRHTRRSGCIAYVTPTSFLAGQYFSNLRSLLRREAPPVAIDFVSARKGVFPDVLQETMLATYRKGRRAGKAAVASIAVATPEKATIGPVGECAIAGNTCDPWLLPRDPGKVDLIRRLNRMPHRLSDWGYAVSTGPLVWNRHKGQFADAAGDGRYPTIWAESVLPDGRFLWRAERRNHRPYFVAERKDDWLLRHEACILLQRTTAKEQPRRLIAAMLPESFVQRHRAVVIENHLNMIRAIVPEPAVPPAVVTMFLNSAAADRVFRCLNGSVAVSAYELQAMPLPSPDALRSIALLIAHEAPRNEIERACERLYAVGG